MNDGTWALWLAAALLIGMGVYRCAEGQEIPPTFEPRDSEVYYKPWPELRAELSEQYRERPAKAGLSPVDNALIVLFEGPGVGGEGTASFVKVLPNGVACLLDAAQPWQEQQPKGNGI